MASYLVKNRDFTIYLSNSVVNSIGTPIV